MPKATALSREECLIAALDQRVVIGDMLNGKLKAHLRRFIELLDWPANRHFACTMVCGGVGWLVTLFVTFAMGGKWLEILKALPVA